MDLYQARDEHLRQLASDNRSASTVRNYDLYEHRYLLFLAEHDVAADLSALNAQFVREWQGWTKAQSHGSRGGVVAVRQGTVILKIWSRFLTDRDYYPLDPLSRLRVPKVQKIHKKPFTPDEARRLVQAAAAGANPIRDRALLLLMFDTGCRVGELCAATVDDLDVSEGRITFSHTKNGRERVVLFRVHSRRDGGPCVAALRQWLKVREANPGVRAIFTTREKDALSSRRVREMFAEFGQMARVPDCHPHRTRHSAASAFYASRPGAEMQLRRRLGHINKDQLDGYVWVSDTDEDAAALASLSTKWEL